MTATPSSDVRDRIEHAVRNNPVMLFMKGTPEAPQCGFSAKVVQILGQLVPSFASADVLSDPELRSGIKTFSDWPTVPQLYVAGEFVGGADIIQEMYASGELHGLLGVAAPAAAAPKIHVTPQAAELLRRASAQAPDAALHLAVDARFRYRLGFGPAEGGELEVASGEFTFLLDRDSARRADGMTLEAVDTPEGARLTIQNPNAPQVAQLTVRELKELLDEGHVPALFDVRTPEERATASIPGSRAFDDEARREIDALPRDTPLVFHCHHGGRSQAAAEHYAAEGFTAVANLVGGIDAWSLEIDPSVPRY